VADGGEGLDRDLLALEAHLRSLETEYNKYFAGRRKRPPTDSRARVDQLVRRLDRLHMPNYGDRFRFGTLQARYAALLELWDRAVRAREEGRPGPFAGPQKSGPARDGSSSDERILHVAAFQDPRREMDKLQDLYEQLSEARRAAGGEAVPFHRFAELIQGQVQQLQQRGSAEVAFRVGVKDGKVRLTAKGMRGRKP
jgi:hypothetical protein